MNHVSALNQFFSLMHLKQGDDKLAHYFVNLCFEPNLNSNIVVCTALIKLVNKKCVSSALM